MLVKVHIDSERGNISLEITFTDRISDVKGKISDKLGCNVAQQRLFFMKSPLEDHKYVSDYNINPESILQLEIQVKLFVRMCSTKIEIDCYPSWSIIEVKHEICRKAKIQENNQMLYFDERLLNDNKTITEYKLQNNSCLDMTGIIMVTINFPSGKAVSYPTNQLSTVYNMKEKICEKNRIPIDRQTLNYKGRELRDEQTFSSIRYRDEDNISLVCKQLPGDEIQVFVKKPGGEKRFISLKKYDPVGKVEDKAGFELENLFLHDCYYNDILLEDTNVLDVYNIQKHSELELKCDGNVVPVLFSSHTMSDVVFYLKPIEKISDVIARVRPKLQAYNEHRRLFHRHNNLNHDQFINDIRVVPGDHLFLGTDDSFTISVTPSGLSFDILVCKGDYVRDLMHQIERKERIPRALQSLYLNGILLDMNQRISQTELRCGSIVQLNIQSDNSHCINIKVRDLHDNSKVLNGINPFLPVWSLSQYIHFSQQDTLVHKDIVLNNAKLLCSYGITYESEILVVSTNPNLLLSQRISPPPVYTNVRVSHYNDPNVHPHHPSPQHSVPPARGYDGPRYSTDIPPQYQPPQQQPPQYQPPQQQPHYRPQQQQQQQQQYQPQQSHIQEDLIPPIRSLDVNYGRPDNLQREITIHILNHPSQIKFQVRCGINESIASLKYKISEEANIPSTKIHLIYEGTRLTNQKMKLIDCRITENSMIELDDVIALSVLYNSTHSTFWVNSSDFVGKLAEEIAEAMDIWKGNIKLSYKGRYLEFQNSFSYYQVPNSSEIIVEDIQ